MTRSHTTTSSDGVPTNRIRRQRPRRDDERSSCNRRITRSSTFASSPLDDLDNVNAIEEPIHTNYDDLTDEELVLMSSTNTESDDEDGDVRTKRKGKLIEERHKEITRTGMK